MGSLLFANPGSERYAGNRIAEAVASLRALFELFWGREATSRLHYMVSHEVKSRGNSQRQIDGSSLGYGTAKLTTVRDVCRIIV
jgi:hypothetical protein